MITTWDYIKALFKPDEKVAIVCKKTDGGKPFSRYLTAAEACNPRFQAELRAKNAHGYNVWISMNPLFPQAQSRSKENIASIKRLFLDMDHDAETNLARLMDDPEIPRPNYILNTSPGKYQVIWNVEGFKQGTAEDTMRALVRRFNADPAPVDISRVLRLPGLHNKKYPQTFQVVAEPHSTQLYQPSDFEAVKLSPQPIDGDSSSASHQPRASKPSRSLSGRDTSPSGQDFGYCCEVLAKARTRNIESVCLDLVAEIEQRASLRHKSNPDYHGYAVRTVENARRKVEEQRQARK